MAAAPMSSLRLPFWSQKRRNMSGYQENNCEHMPRPFLLSLCLPFLMSFLSVRLSECESSVRLFVSAISLWSAYPFACPSRHTGLNRVALSMRYVPRTSLSFLSLESLSPLPLRSSASLSVAHSLGPFLNLSYHCSTRFLDVSPTPLPQILSCLLIRLCRSFALPQPPRSAPRARREPSQ